MSTPKHEYYSTMDTFNFIKQLGKFSSVLTPRRILLERYIEAAKRRAYWDNKNSRAIILYAEKSLEQEGL